RHRPAGRAVSHTVLAVGGRLPRPGEAISEQILREVRKKAAGQAQKRPPPGEGRGPRTPRGRQGCMGFPMDLAGLAGSNLRRRAAEPRHPQLIVEPAEPRYGRPTTFPPQLKLYV